MPISSIPQKHLASSPPNHKEKSNKGNKSDKSWKTTKQYQGQSASEYAKQFPSLVYGKTPQKITKQKVNQGIKS